MRSRPGGFSYPKENAGMLHWLQNLEVEQSADMHRCDERALNRIHTGVNPTLILFHSATCLSGRAVIRHVRFNQEEEYLGLRTSTFAL